MVEFIRQLDPEPLEFLADFEKRIHACRILLTWCLESDETPFRAVAEFVQTTQPLGPFVAVVEDIGGVREVG